MARRKIIAGNWKMNKTPSEAVALVEELKPLVANDAVDVVFCVPAIDIVPVVEAVKGTNIQVGAENMYFEESGAYTGEISPAMLVDAGVKYVVLGHSERRDYFGETNEDVNKKVLKALEHGITPIMCCGESLEQRELILILVFSFSGCGKSDDTVEYDQEQLEQYADFIVQNFSMMGEADFQNFSDMSDLELEMTLLQAGVPVTGENFLTMMGAWDAGEQECGEFVGLKDGYTMETTNEGALLTVEGDFAERDGALEFAFDKKGNIESLTIGAHYSTAEILKKAGCNLRPDTRRGSDRA